MKLLSLDFPWQKIVNDINHTMKYCKQSFQPSSCILEAIKELNDTLLTAFKTPSKKVAFIFNIYQ